MSTRSLTHILEYGGEEICCIYRHCDGYPSGMGSALAELLSGYLITNGIGSNTPPKCASGMGCLAAQVVAWFKNENPLGNIYLYPSGSKDLGEEYVYTVYPMGDSVWLRVESVRRKNHKILYDGPVSDFNAEKAEANE